jgi:predicted transcriptional regulator
MLDLVELSAKIVLNDGAEKKSSAMIISEIKDVYATLLAMEKGEVPEAYGHASPNVVTPVTHFGNNGEDEIKCLMCGQGGMKILKQHLRKTHHITPDEYKEQFHIPRYTPLVSPSYHNVRRNLALASAFGKKKTVTITVKNRKTK